MKQRIATAVVLFGFGSLMLSGWLMPSEPAPYGARPEAPQQTPAPPARSTALPAMPDTLYQQVQAGEILIFALPDSLAGRPVAAYAVVRAPALSWLVDRSFFWRTLEQDDGRHALRLAATFADRTTDTLVVSVHVTPR